MKKNFKSFLLKGYLDNLFNNANSVEIDINSKIVIFSDLHVGTRTRRDDFLPNSKMFLYLLEKYYLAGGYTLILNGDVEELQKRPLHKVKEKWPDLYALFDAFASAGRLYKITGNHDSDLYKHTHEDINSSLLESLILKHEGNRIFIFHGHQAALSYMLTQGVLKYFLKYIAHPLGIKNFTRSYDNPHVHNTEKFVYQYSLEKKIISIIGHTHRPLFESLSELDLLRFKIEQLLRIYPESHGLKTKIVEEEIGKYKQEIETIFNENHEYGFRSSLYNQELVIPCIFNSGSVIGRRGLTGIEISGCNISLVHWFDKSRNVKNYSYNESLIKKLPDSSYCKMVMKSDSLDYIFTRIKLLS